MNKKFAFFDFDDTLIHGDSIAKLQTYILQKKPYAVVYYFKFLIYGLLYVLHIVSIEKVKSTLLFPIDLLNEEQLRDFFQTAVVPSYYPHMVEELKKRKEEGCIVVLATASSYAYMQYNDLPIDVLFGTQTKQVEGHYTSQIIGNNCKNEEKVNLIQDYLKNQGFTIDYDHSYAYSDSPHDIPMLSLVKNRYKVDTTDGHLSPFVF